MQFASLPLGTDNIIVVLLQTTGLPSDTIIKRAQFLSNVISAGAVEATFTNYSRQVQTNTNVVVSVNTSTDVVSLGLASVVWNAAGGAVNNSLSALLVCYRPTSASADSAITVLTKHDFVGSTTGGNLTATITTIATAT
jgi:hypothetical protein